MSGLVWFIIISTAFVRGGSFLSLPFLSVYLIRNFHLSIALTGLIVGLNPLASMIAGFYGGYLSDFWGRKKILVFSSLICALAYACFALANGPWQFAILNFIIGAFAGSLTTSLKALLADVASPSKRHGAFRLQYFAINVGASIGPLVGAHFLISNSTDGFLITAGLFFVFAVSFCVFNYIVRTKSSNPPPGQLGSPLNFRACLKILREDHAFLFLIVGSICMGLSYAQIDTLLPQYLRQLMGDPGISLFAQLLAANSVIVLVGLYPVLWITKKIGAAASINYGQVLVAVGFTGMAFVRQHALGFFICMFVLTLGEILAFSNWSVIIDSYAPSHLKGTYFGAAGFNLLGSCLAPFIGGALYDLLGVIPSFSILGLITAAGTLFYLRAARLRAIPTNY